MRRAHATYFLTMAERAEPELAGPEAGIWLDRLGIEHDNLRGALAWAMERGDADTGLRLVAAVFRFWVVRGHLREGRAWAERLLALEPDDQDEVGRAEVGALGGAASGHGAARGTPLAEHERMDMESILATARADLGAEHWAAAFADGRALSLEAAVAEALGEV